MSLPSQTRWRELVRKLQALEWEGPLYGTKHPFMLKGKRKLHIPNPHDDPIYIPLLRKILRQAEITNDEWDSA